MIYWSEREIALSYEESRESRHEVPRLTPLETRPFLSQYVTRGASLDTEFATKCYHLALVMTILLVASLASFHCLLWHFSISMLAAKHQNLLLTNFGDVCANPN